MTLIRPMVVTDVEALGRMHHAAWRDTYGDALPADQWARWTVASAVARWRQILDAPAPSGVRRLVAIDTGKMAGFVVVGPAQDIPGRPAPVRPVALWAVYVAHSQLGSGVAQRLLDDALGPEQPAELWVWRDNARAQAFYRRNGFAPDGGEYLDPEIPELPEIRMVREVWAPPLG